MSNRLHAIFDETIERLRRGESPTATLAAHPEDAAALHPLLEPARRILRLPAPPEPQRAAEGWANLRSRLAQERQRREGTADGRGNGRIFAGLFAPLLALGQMAPSTMQAAGILVAAVLLGVTGLATAAAIGESNVFSPVTGLFDGGGPSAAGPSSNGVEFQGVITSIDGLTFTANLTEFEGSGLVGCTNVQVDGASAEVKGPLGVGNTVKVEGTVVGECNVRAREVKTLAAVPPATPTAPANPGAAAPAATEAKFHASITAINGLSLTMEVIKLEEGSLNGCATITVDLSRAEKIEGPLAVGSVVEAEGLLTGGCNLTAREVEAWEAEDGEERDDDRGPGNGDDIEDQHDNSGPGDGAEIEDQDDNSGRGGGAEDEGGDDNSGPGNGED
jgi:hypothetical protein